MSRRESIGLSEWIFMPRLAANLTMMFNEVDVLDRIAAARAAGFHAVSISSPTGSLRRSSQQG